MLSVTEDESRSVGEIDGRPSRTCTVLVVLTAVCGHRVLTWID